MNIPAELKYTKEHEWVKIEGSTATVGITEFAQAELGDVVFVEKIESGVEVEQSKEMSTIESVKAASDLFAPVSGKIIEFNDELEDQPGMANSDPYASGWIVKIEINDHAELDKLLSAEEYEKLISQ